MSTQINDLKFLTCQSSCGCSCCCSCRCGWRCCSWHYQILCLCPTVPGVPPVTCPIVDDILQASLSSGTAQSGGVRLKAEVVPPSSCPLFRAMLTARAILVSVSELKDNFNHQFDIIGMFAIFIFRRLICMGTIFLNLVEMTRLLLFQKVESDRGSFFKVC